MWDGGGTNMNLTPLLWVPYHMTIIKLHSINLGIILNVWHLRPYHYTISQVNEHG